MPASCRCCLRVLRASVAIAGLILYSSQQATAQSAPSDTALAHSLAAELAKAGVNLSAGDLKQMLQGIANGGEASEALAQSISRALVQATSDLNAVAAGQDPGPELDQSEIDQLLKSLPSTGDSAAQLSRFLKEKLRELERAQSP